MLNILLAVLILAVFSFVSLFMRFRIWKLSFPYNPVLRMIVGPFVLVFIGLGFLLVGVIGTSPITLLIKGHPGWAAFMFIFLLVCSIGTKIESGGIDVSYDTPVGIRMLIGMLIFIVGGAVFAVIGTILASPALLIFSAF